jgi:hypothetical protein
VIFDRASKKSWSRKLYVKEVKLAGRKRVTFFLCCKTHYELSHIRENLYEGRDCGWEEDNGGVLVQAYHSNFVIIYL